MHLTSKFILNGVVVDNITTIITEITTNENGIIFTASSYDLNFNEIKHGETIPFRSWGYFCNKSDRNDEETAYYYLLTMAEYIESHFIS